MGKVVSGCSSLALMSEATTVWTFHTGRRSPVITMAVDHCSSTPINRLMQLVSDRRVTIPVRINRTVAPHPFSSQCQEEHYCALNFYQATNPGSQSRTTLTVIRDWENVRSRQMQTVPRPLVPRPSPVLPPCQIMGNTPYPISAG